MQEQQVSIEGKAMDVPNPFMTIATQNRLNRKDVSVTRGAIDRFMLKIHIDYPSALEEDALVQTVISNRVGDVLDVSEVETSLSPTQVLELQRMAAHIRVDVPWSTTTPSAWYARREPGQAYV